MNGNDDWEPGMQETGSMKKSVGLSALSTTVDEFMWISVDKRGISIRGGHVVDKRKSGIGDMHMLSTDLTPPLAVGNRAFEKKG